MSTHRTPLRYVAISNATLMVAAMASLAACSAAGGVDTYEGGEQTQSAVNYVPPQDGTGGESGGGTGGQGGSQAGGGSGGTDQGWPSTGGSNGESTTAGGFGGDNLGGSAGQGAGGSTGQEICGNERDDDGDGSIDEDCDPIPCEDTEGHNCNGDMGYGDRCAPEDNENGCTPDRFWAWCNRRNDQYPGIWDDYLRGWIVDRCDGNVTLEDPNQDGYSTFMCTDSLGHTWECTTPLVLSFDPLSALTLAPSDHRFDLGAGAIARDWPAGNTPWLVIDRNRNGLIDNGSELFGSSTPLAAGARASNGFEALRSLDSNVDGSIDANDESFSALSLWYDRNGDGRTQSGEMISASAAGLSRIDLGYWTAVRCSGSGSCERERSTFVWADAAGEHTGAVIDVYLRTTRDDR